ncbi:hypothetical protein VTN02DRAFT_369 [Thermoascus thermophilus]
MEHDDRLAGGGAMLPRGPHASSRREPRGSHGVTAIRYGHGQTVRNVGLRARAAYERPDEAGGNARHAALGDAQAGHDLRWRARRRATGTAWSL